MGRDDFTCRMCGDRGSTLHVHHFYYTRNAEPWDYPDGALITVCEWCHDELHSGNFGGRLLEALVSRGAGILDLEVLLCTLVSDDEAVNEDGELTPGKRLSAAQFTELNRAIQYVLRAVLAGALSKDIGTALDLPLLPVHRRRMEE